MMHERRSTQGSQHRQSMSKQSAAPAASSSSSFSSSCSCFATTLRNCGHVPEAAWSMSSVLTALPESPSPICSCSHPTSSNTLLPTHYLQDSPTEFSSPRNQSSGMADDDNNNNCAICFSDIDEWLEHANKFCKPSNSHTTHLTGPEDEEEEEEEDIERMSAICSNTFLRAPENELYNITLPSIREESPGLQGQTRTRLSCIYGHAPSPSNERRTLLSGTKPYNTQLWSDEPRRKKKHEAERSKARHDQLVNRMRRKEKAIDNWEVKQTRRAMDEMDKIQNKLERKQLMASVRTQKKICTVRDKAEKQKLNLRQQTLKRFQQLQTSETKSPTHSSWSSRLPLC